MWSATLAGRELRSQFGRVLASLLAVLLSSAFLVAAQVDSATEANATFRRDTLWLSGADVVVETHLWHAPHARQERDFALQTAQDSLRAQPQVDATGVISELSSRLSANRISTNVMLTAVPAPAVLTSVVVSQGRLPASRDEVVLTTQSAEQLGTGLGGTVTVGMGQGFPLTVVGLSPERGYDQPPAYVTQELLLASDRLFPRPYFNVIVDPNKTAPTTPGSSGDGVGQFILVHVRDRRDTATVIQQTQAALDHAGIMHVFATVRSADEIRQRVAAQDASQPKLVATVLLGSAVVALVIGALLVLNTFTIRAEQRRREAGLLRAVGASRAQIVGLFAMEGLILGIVGATIGAVVGVGVAWVITAQSGAARFGLEVPLVAVLLAVLSATAATLLAALRPALATARLRPLAALQGTTAERDRRGAVLALAAAVAVGLPAVALLITSRGAGAPVIVLLTLVVLVALLVSLPALIAALGIAAARLSPTRWVTTRLAAGNLQRSPQRSAQTLAPLVIAVTLISTVQVGTATGLAAANKQLDARYPADLVLEASVPEPEVASPLADVGPHSDRGPDGMLRSFDPGTLTAVQATPGVAAAMQFTSSEGIRISYGAQYAWMPVVALPAASAAVLHRPTNLTDDQIGLDPYLMHGMGIKAGDAVTLSPLQGTTITLHAVECGISDQLGVVTPAVLAELHVASHPSVIIATLTDPERAGNTTNRIQTSLGASYTSLTLSGGARSRAALAAQIQGLGALMTGLLAIAATVALVGVSNSIALSVLERRHELAVLRALGLRRAGIWRLLGIEALTLGLLANLLGITLGTLLGWRIAATIARQLGAPSAGLRGHPLELAGVALIIAIASVIAALGPSSRATKPQPAAALAEQP